MISAIVLAIKFYDDNYYNNEYYSKIGGISCLEMNKLESELLSLLNFDLHVLPEVFEQYSQDLAARASDQGTIMDDVKPESKITQTWSQSSINTVPSSGDICQEESQ